MARRKALGALASAASIGAVAALTACSTPVPALRTSIASSPAPEFPRITGEVLAVEAPVPGDWILRLRVRDADAAYAASRARLTDAGYLLTKDREGRGGGDGQACTPRLCVGFGASDVPPAGPVLVYEVFHSTGIVG